jgi:hypothetical protein
LLVSRSTYWCVIEGRQPTAHLAAIKQSGNTAGGHDEIVNKPSGGLMYEPSELIPIAPSDIPAEDSPAIKPPDNRKLESPQYPESILDSKPAEVRHPKKPFVAPDLPPPPQDPIVLPPPPDASAVVAAFPALAVPPALNGTKVPKPPGGFKRALRALFGASANSDASHGSSKRDSGQGK